MTGSCALKCESDGHQLFRCSKLSIAVHHQCVIVIHECQDPWNVPLKSGLLDLLSASAAFLFFWLCMAVELLTRNGK